MTAGVFRIFFAVLLMSIVLSRYAFAQHSVTSAWKTEEMTRTGTKALTREYGEQEIKVQHLKVWLDNLKDHLKNNGLSEAPPDNCGDRCFDLYYFTGGNFNLNSGRKNLLYIAGGPGQIVISPRPLSFLEDDYNVVYFNLRGAGLSVIPSSNSFDKYLKAEYVVEDIERLRKAVLKGKKWDAIYSFSYGTVVAQRYAHEYPDKVDRLILEAPIVRNIDFAGQRTEMALNNLEKIYRLISSEPSEPCDCTGRTLQATFVDGNPSDSEENNLCFLTPPASSPDTFEGRMKKIRASLEEIYKRLESAYGVLGFVTENYDSELQSDPTYKTLFGYPKEFVFALRQLQNIGAPEKDSLKFVRQIYDWVDVALVLGYYAMSTGNALCPIGKDCMADNPFLKFVTNQNCKDKNIYVDRIKKAKKDILNKPLTESQRALYVYGVNDGLHRWLLELLNDEASTGATDLCLNSAGRIRFLQRTDPEHGLLRKIVKKIGFEDAISPCLWSPKNYQHKVPSLVLKGGDDAVTAGCQAEAFFNDGLKGSRVMFEFPGAGHGLYILFEGDSPQQVIGGLLEGFDSRKRVTDNYKKLIQDFLTESSVENYESRVHGSLVELKAKDRTPANPEGIVSCAR